MKKLKLKGGEKGGDEKKRSKEVDWRKIEKNRISETIDKNRRGERKVRVIPPRNNKFAHQNLEIIRVAAYCRVSTLDEMQMGSFEMQIQHFKKIIESNPQYELVDIYADEGISGTSVKKRIGFQKMIEDAKAGKIDLILTKSISRFGRNIVDIISTLRELRALFPPVAVNFESEGIFSSDSNSQLIITLLSSIAELESQQKSIAIREGIQYRMQEGIYKFSVKNILGYYRDYLGQVRVEPVGAQIVSYIYDSLIEGASPEYIALSLTDQAIPTPMGLKQWRSSTVKSILTNEKYKGDVLYQKTFSQDYLSSKSIKNEGILQQYYWTNLHPAIIDEGRWEKAQGFLKLKQWSKRKSLIKDISGKFIVGKIKSGLLRGYYLIDFKWSMEEQKKFIEIIKSETNLERGSDDSRHR